MKQVIHLHEKGQRALKSLYSLGGYVNKCAVEQPLLQLIYFRVSQMNGCAFCSDMHSKDLRAAGETEQRLYLVNVWRDTPVFTERERAALAWAEALTRLNGGQVDETVHNEVLQQFSEQEAIDLTFAIITINSYNRVHVAFPNPAAVGTYTPGMFATN